MAETKGEKNLLKVFGMKDINRFIVRELDTEDAKRFQQMNKMLQKTYNAKHVAGKGVFKEGSFVAALGCPDGEPKQWLRGVVIENYHKKNHLFAVYFADYGFDKTCNKSEMRELVPHMYPSFVPFQAFNFYLTDIDRKRGVDDMKVINEIQKQMEKNMFEVWAAVEHKDRTGSYGSITVDGDCDLAAILIDKGLVNDIHHCHRNRSPSIDSNGNYTTHRTGFSFSRKWQSKGRKSEQDLLCKCNDIIKYRRKELEETLKRIETQNKAKSLEQRLTQSV